MFIMNIIKSIIDAQIYFLKADWWILLIGIMIAVGINVYMEPAKLKNMLHKNSGVSILGAVGFGSLTPLCACGTMAVLLSMFVSALPWGPVMAFLVTSPLVSPVKFVFQTSFIGLPLAIANASAAVLGGILVGFLATYLERKTGFFKNQYRLVVDSEVSCCGENKSEIELKPAVGCCDSSMVNSKTIGKKVAVRKKNAKLSNVNQSSCCSNKLVLNKVDEKKNSCCGSGERVKLKDSNSDSFIKRWKLDQVVKQVYELGIKRVVLYFMLFIAIGQLIQILVPANWILAAFRPDRFYSIPLAATIGLPLYVSGNAALPILEVLRNVGAGEGAILAFMIAGQGTSAGVLAGIATFLNKRAIIFYAGAVYVLSIVSGLLFHYVMMWLN